MGGWPPGGLAAGTAADAGLSDEDVAEGAQFRITCKTLLGLPDPQPPAPPSPKLPDHPAFQ